MISLNGDTLRPLLKEAYKVNISERIVGPSWLDEDCFQIVAKLPSGATKDQIPAMLEALLVERFKLAVHKESRAVPGYVLEVDKNGSKLKESDPNSPDTLLHAGQVTFGASPGAAGIKCSMTIASLARQLSNRLRVPVQDLTALDGKYNVDLRWVPDLDLEANGPTALYAQPQPTEDARFAGLSKAPTLDIFAAVRTELGLRLESRKTQEEFIVIDHIERIPTEN